MHKLIPLGFIALGFCAATHAQSYSKAVMLYDHGLVIEARKELIEVVFSAGNAADKPKALLLLGNLALDRESPKTALDAWNRLIREYPKSPEATTAKERIPVLQNVVGKIADEVIDNAIAKSYLRSGDFWSSKRSEIFKIDSSWIPNVEAASVWYDKVIAEFAGTNAARRAFEAKMETLVGWKETGQYGSTYGIMGDHRKYMPILEATFSEYEKAFPEAASQQAFRYQIAQGYWKAKDWENTRKWLNQIITKSSGSSFYKDLAERRLQKVEY